MFFFSVRLINGLDPAETNRTRRHTGNKKLTDKTRNIETLKVFNAPSNKISLYIKYFAKLLLKVRQLESKSF